MLCVINERNLNLCNKNEQNTARPSQQNSQPDLTTSFHKSRLQRIKRFATDRIKKQIKQQTIIAL